MFLRQRPISCPSARKHNFVFLRGFVEAKRIINAIVSIRHSDKPVAHGAPPPKLHPPFTRAECSLLQCLRTGSGLTSQVLERFGRGRN